MNRTRWDKTIYLIAVLLSSINCHGQFQRAGDNTFYLSAGLFSTDQLLGIGAQDEPIRRYMNFEGHATTALFLSYHHAFSKKFTLGVASGIDHQCGGLGYDEHSYNYSMKPIGDWVRRAYTIAIEGQLHNYSKGNYDFYGLVGAGGTYASVTHSFTTNVPDSTTLFGTPRSIFPTNPFTKRHIYFDGQFSPFCFRTNGTFTEFIELGFGYKGLVCVGASYRINSKKKHTIKPLSKSGNALLLREDQEIDSNFVYKGIALSGYKIKDLQANSSFISNAAQLSELSKEMDGNVIRLTSIKQRGPDYQYKLGGEVYDFVGPDSALKKLKSHPTFPDSLAGKALVMVYYPHNRHYLNAKNYIHYFVNGQGCFDMTTGDQKLLVMDKAGKYKVSPVVRLSI